MDYKKKYLKYKMKYLEAKKLYGGLNNTNDKEENPGKTIAPKKEDQKNES